MKELMVSLAFASLCALLIITGLSVWHLKNAVVTTTEHANQLIDESNRRLIDTARNTNAMLIQVSLVADNVRKASEAQRIYVAQSQQILQQTQDTLITLRKSIEETSGNTNATIKTFDQSLKNADAGLTAALQAATIALKHSQELLSNPDLVGAIDNLNLTTAELAKVAPALAENVQTTTANMAVATEHAAKVTENVEKLTKPKGFLRAIIPGVIGGIAGRIFISMF